jgi:uncharacterized membrane protein YeiH
MRKSTFSLGVATLGVFGTIIVYLLHDSPNHMVELQFFAGLALMGGLTYVIARRAERNQYLGREDNWNPRDKKQ